MQPETASQVKELVARFYASDEDADAALEALIGCVRPHIRQRLARKDDGHEELEDLCSESVRRLVEATQRSRAPDCQPIREYISYALATADNVFAHHLRRTRPNWCRLRRRLIYLLDEGGRGRFARWKAAASGPPVGPQPDPGWLGGFARWRGQSFRDTPRYQAFCADYGPFCRAALQHRDPREVPLPELVGHLFEEVGTPLEVDELTRHLAALHQVSDSPPLSLEGLREDSGCRDHAPIPPGEDLAASVVRAVASEQLRPELWRQICQLPLSQRWALLLDLQPDDLLLVARRMTSVAAALQMPEEEFHITWRRLPLPDPAIAERLKISPKQVSNLRIAAKRRVARWLAGISS
jgi:hypothetical protein